MASEQSLVLGTEPLGFPWVTEDPFLFCAHHLDKYPAGDAEMGVQADLTGRQMGSDFSGRNGFSMYHGLHVPGFPQHPHRGFETVTIARSGWIDHSDSLGATARFSAGDVQWITAGGGIVHSEMFPLRDESGPNPTELFQIWLNLPRRSKMVPAHFKMFWSEQVPRLSVGEDGSGGSITVISGHPAGGTALEPPPHSWAAEPNTGVEILVIHLEQGASWTLQPAAEGARRNFYFFSGASLACSAPGGEPMLVSGRTRISVRPDLPCTLRAVGGPADVLVLGGRPIGEPVVAHGPFVMNSVAEIQQAFHDYRRTQFGGWPWKSDGPVHERARGRFAVHADGALDQPKVP